MAIARTLLKKLSISIFDEATSALDSKTERAFLGGNLARVAISRGARVEALLISDVTGDSPADIASGPCAADYSTI